MNPAQGNYRPAEIMYETVLRMAEGEQSESEGVSSALTDLASVQHDQVNALLVFWSDRA